MQSTIEKNIEHLFLRRDKQSQQWEKREQFLEQYGTGQQLEEFWKGAKNYLTEYYIRNFVNCLFSEDINDNSLSYYREVLQSLEILGEYNQNSVTLNAEDQQCEIKRASHILPEFAKYRPEIKNFEGRKGRCHSLSADLALFVGGDARVVTGDICGKSDKAKYLHSWVEMTDAQGVEIAIDLTLDAVFLKQDYRDIMHAQVQSEIGWKTIEDDRYWLEPLSEITWKTYYIFRDEFKADIDSKHPPEFWEDEK